MSSRRVSWIDICRGIGIIFVMYGHVLGSDASRYLIYSFHMPLFFFLSGVVFHHRHYVKFLTFLKKTIKGILLPYFFFAFAEFLIWFFSFQNESFFSHDVLHQLYGIFYASGNNGFLGYNVVLWFLPCLFVTKLAFALLTKVSIKKRFIISALTVFSLVGYLFSVYLPNTALPFCIEVSFSAIVFFGAGYLWNQNETIHTFIHHYRKQTFFVSISLCAILATINFRLSGHQIDMRVNHLSNYFLFYTAALSGVISWVAFSMMINKNAILESIGRNSLLLFAWHPVLFDYFGEFSQNFIDSNVVNSFQIILPAFYTILATGIILFLNSLYKKAKTIPEDVKREKEEL